MRKIAIFLIILYTLNFNLNAQCESIATNFGNNDRVPSYNITDGVVKVILSADGNEVTLDLNENFKTGSGPDIRVYIINSNNLSDIQIKRSTINNLDHIEFGLVGSNTVDEDGAKSFTVTIPDSKNIENYDKVFFYCLEFNQFWDFGTFESFSNESCNVLSIEDKEFEGIGLTNNPVKDVINITNPNQQELEIRIFDTAGNLVASKDGKNQNNQLDVSGLSTGLYVVELQSGTSKKADKLVIQ